MGRGGRFRKEAVREVQGVGEVSKLEERIGQRREIGTDWNTKKGQKPEEENRLEQNRRKQI